MRLKALLVCPNTVTEGKKGRTFLKPQAASPTLPRQAHLAAQMLAGNFLQFFFNLFKKYSALKSQYLKALCFPQVAGSYQTKHIYFSQLHPHGY